MDHLFDKPPCVCIKGSVLGHASEKNGHPMKQCCHLLLSDVYMLVSSFNSGSRRLRWHFFLECVVKAEIRWNNEIKASLCTGRDAGTWHSIYTIVWTGLKHQGDLYMHMLFRTICLCAQEAAQRYLVGQKGLVVWTCLMEEVFQIAKHEDSIGWQARPSQPCLAWLQNTSPWLLPCLSSRL